MATKTEQRVMPAESAALPATLRAFRNYHAGETLLVCGCGASLSQVVAPERFVSIGVNDVGRLFHPDYLVVLNPRHQFAGDRFRHVEESRARAIFSQLSLGIRHPNVIHIRLGRRGGSDDADPDVLHYTRNSPYLALNLAMYMGASRIGLIGVDFTEHHFFSRTGIHPLARELDQINREYAQLADAGRRRGIEIVNLSAESRLTVFPKMSPERFANTAFINPAAAEQVRRARVFFIHYRFLSCGDVFRTGLVNAATDLEIEHDGTWWNDPELPEKLKKFSPDLLFVVHGRRFVHHWKNRFAKWKSAVWLLDEPYEVDDTSRFSAAFDIVFVNDPQTVTRHRNAHYLPVAYDPHAHTYKPGEPRPHIVGFVGGANPAREKMLAALAERQLLAYVVGGPWREARLRALSLAANLPAEQIASLYRQTQIVPNVFRTAHHYNRSGVEAFSLNPRVYEAAACGAVVLSEYRPELNERWPGAPSFQDADGLISRIAEMLQNPGRLDDLRREGIRGFSRDIYAARLSRALEVALELPSRAIPLWKPYTLAALDSARQDSSNGHSPIRAAGAVAGGVDFKPLPFELSEAWEACGNVVTADSNGTVVLSKPDDPSAGSEQGLTGRIPYEDVCLSFEVFPERGAAFIAKIHLQEPCDQSTNSYHFFAQAGRAYLARHHRVLASFALPENTWTRIRLIYAHGRLSVRIDDGAPFVCREDYLARGHCFLGLKGGGVRLRNVHVTADVESELIPAIAPPEHRILRGANAYPRPALSIITTVYDRVECLQRCLRSVNALSYKNYEHIVVADCPGDAIVDRLLHAVEASGHPERRLLANLESRHNNWGIAPAAAGLSLARGKYVTFLSDDNGYLHDHFQPLIAALEDDPRLGFAYSSCLYAGRLVLRHPVPRMGGIDLGQPVFRRELFDLHCDGVLPFAEAAWDWRMIELLMRKGARWKHIDRSSFVFRLASYPSLVAALP